VHHTFGSLDGMVATVKGMLSTYEDAEALQALRAARETKSGEPLVQIAAPVHAEAEATQVTR
jgi:hypothetical protein